MAFNKKEVLENNIKAIEIALSNRKSLTEDEKALLRNYKGFGGIKAVLYPIENPDLFIGQDKLLIEPLKQLHELLRNNSKNENEYQKYYSSIKNSILSAFYTPNSVVSAIGDSLKVYSFNKMLEPSAGAGVFLDLIHATGKTAIEKDLITARILSALHPDKEIIQDSFENTRRSFEGSFDLVASNIPFGNIPVFDPVYFRNKEKAKKEASKSVHNYFFLKGIDMLQDGGVLAFITSNGVMDSKDNEIIRKALFKEAKLISAVRLPHNLFADTGGIEVGSDLIILQKDINRGSLTEEERLFIKTPNEKSIHPFFERGENLINCVYSKLMTTTDQFNKPIILRYEEGGERVIADKVKIFISKDLETNLNTELLYKTRNNKQQGSLFEEELPLFKTDANGQLSLFDDFFEEKIVTAPVSAKEIEKIDVEQEAYNLYASLRDVYFDLIMYERQNQIENKELRELLNNHYDSFVGKFGTLYKTQNILISEDKDYIELTGIEKIENKNISKSDIFFSPVSIKTHAEDLSVSDALNVSLNELNSVDLDYIGQLSGKTENEIKNELLGIQIFYNPIFDIYQTTAQFLSGDVVEKIQNLKNILDFSEAGEKGNEIRMSIEGLEKIRPEILSLEEIGINFGERWIPEKYYEEFSEYLLNPPGSSAWNREKLNVNYLGGNDDFAVSNNRYSSYASELYSVKTENRRYKYDAVFRFALLDIVPDMTIKKMVDGVEKRYPDNSGIQKMNAAIDDIRKKFKEWAITRLPEADKKELAQIYNDKFRNIVKAEYNGTFQTFPGLNYENLNIKELYDTQKNAILMLKQNGGGIVDHEVGGGKTLIQCVAAYEMKRLGAVNKPAILGLKANIHEIAETYKKAYPHAQVLYPTKKDLDNENIDNFLSKIQNNNWDVVIMSHEQFGKIPQSAEIQEKILNEEIDKLNEAMLSIYEGGNMSDLRKVYKQLEKRVETLRIKTEELNYLIREKKSGNVIDFDTMGIDHLFLDESHKYKNLRFTTKHNRVAGLGNAQGSQRAQNMLYAIRTIQEKTGKDLGATFLSGTTISNSLTELYNIFNYLRPQALQRQGIFSFDAWLATYAVKSKEFEFSVTNDIIQKERFRHFCKVPELASFYAEITDYKTAEMIGVDRPDMNEVLIDINQTLDQVDMYNRLKEFAKTAEGELIFREPLTDSEEKAKMLIATNVAKAASLDMRLVNSSFDEDTNNKINVCVRNVMKYYQEYDHAKGSQFVFCDLGTYDKSKEWDVYSELKRKFVEAGVPESEIQFIQNFNTDERKKKFQKMMNDGEIRIGVGSTEMLGTGVNAQKRAVAVHHLDIPWTPKDFIQRNGRAVRAGNKVAKEHAGNKVDVFIYAVKQTLDVYQFNLQATKSKFISQIKLQNINVRSIDEGGIDDQSGMNFNEYIAILSGDTSLLEKAKLEKKITQLRSEEKIYFEKNRNKDKQIETLKGQLDKTNEYIEKLKNDKDNFLSIPKDAEGNIQYKVNLIVPTINKSTEEITINSGSPYKEYKDIEQAGVALNTICEIKNDDSFDLIKVGEFYGFNIGIKAQGTQFGNMMTYENRFYVYSDNEITYNHNHGQMPRTSDKAGLYVVNALNKIDGLIESTEKRVTELKADLAGIMAIDNREFPKKDELDLLEKELREVIAKIEKNINKNQDMNLIDGIGEDMQREIR